MTSPAAIEELERVLGSAQFTGSPRLARLLRYIVEKSLAGDCKSLKEYAIGLDVFDRGPSFDPKADSIVRATARQLRLKLAEYYQSEGSGDPVRIAIPKGAYIAEIISSQVQPSVSRTRPWNRTAAVATAIALALAALAFSLAWSRHAPAVRARSVAVLAFRDLSPDGSLGYLGEELREGLSSALVRTKGLELTARASAGQRSAEITSPDAAKAAIAGTLVTGSVGALPGAASGPSIQVVVNLQDDGTGKFLWSRTYQGAPVDIGAIEHSAAIGIAAALGASAEVPAPQLPRNPQALELFVRASSLARTRNPAQMRDAAKLFERVLALEPDFALGYASAADNYLAAVNNGVMSWGEAGARGIALARKAVELEPTLAEAHAALGLGLEEEWKWNEAGNEFSRAIELDPRSPVAYFREAVDLICRSRFSDAAHAIGVARMLDPSWGAPEQLQAELYYYTRRWEDALVMARHIRDTRSDGASVFANIGWRVYTAQGKLQLARPFLAAEPDLYNNAWLRAIDGDLPGAWRDLLAARRSSQASAFRLAAFAALGLRDRQQALDWLEESLRDHEPDLVSLAIDPAFDSVRVDPRAQAILRDIHLAP